MLCLPYYAYVFFSTKLEVRAEQVLPGSERGREVEGGGGVQGGELTQTMFAHVNKWIIKNFFKSWNLNYVSIIFKNILLEPGTSGSHR
jgi:hypothetical protein